MAVVEKTIDIIGDDGFSAVLLARNNPVGNPVDFYDEAVTSIKSYAIYNIAGIESVNFPNVISVRPHGISKCADLRKIFLPAATTLSSNALRENRKLEDVSLPLVAYLPDYTFLEANALKTIELPKVTSCGSAPFFTCKGLEEAVMPRLKSTGNMFYGCSALKKMDFPSVESIGGNCFYYCTSLEVVNIGPNIKTINSMAFTGTPAGLVINLPVAEDVISGAPWGATEAVINYEVPYAGTVPIPED